MRERERERGFWLFLAFELSENVLKFETLVWSCCGSKKIFYLKKEKKKLRRCRGSNPGHPRDRREYLPLYYNDLLTSLSTLVKYVMLQM